MARPKTPSANKPTDPFTKTATPAIAAEDVKSASSTPAGASQRANARTGTTQTGTTQAGVTQAEAVQTDTLKAGEAKSAAGTRPQDIKPPDTKPAETAKQEKRPLEMVRSEGRANLLPINLDDEIRRRAYEISERRGFEGGHETDDWLRAENEIRQRYQQQSA